MEQHFTFKGIEICGSPREITEKLVSVGFADMIPESITTLRFSGEFAGIECTLGIFMTPISNQAFQILVDCIKDTCESPSSFYNKYKKIFIGKYRNPKKELNNGEFRSCKWELDLGKIEIMTLFDGAKIIIYTDTHNNRLAEQENKQLEMQNNYKIMNDI